MLVAFIHIYIYLYIYIFIYLRLYKVLCCLGELFNYLKA